MSGDELNFISVLETITGALAVDCIIDSKQKRVIYIVNRGDTGKVIGKGGTTIQRLKEHIGKDLEVVEYADNPERFARNTIAPARPRKVEIVERNGKKAVIITVNPGDKGKAIGKEGKNIQKSRLLMKRHFGIDRVIIQSTD